jgi:hypothetical protein
MCGHDHYLGHMDIMDSKGKVCKQLIWLNRSGSCYRRRCRCGVRGRVLAAKGGGEGHGCNRGKWDKHMQNKDGCKAGEADAQLGTYI